MDNNSSNEHIKGRYGVAQALITAFATLMAACIALVPQIAELKQENSALTKQNNALIAESNTDGVAAESTIANLKKQISDLTEEKIRIESEYEAEVSGLQDQIDHLKEELDNFITPSPLPEISSPETSTEEAAPVTVSGEPKIWLTDMDYFYHSGKWIWNADDTEKDNLGNAGYNHTISVEEHDNSIIYELDGKYNRITGVLFQKYTVRSSNFKTKFTILADGIKIWTGEMTGGVKPVNFDENLNHATELEIVCHSEAYSPSLSRACLGNVALWVS